MKTRTIAGVFLALGMAAGAVGAALAHDGHPAMIEGKLIVSGEGRATAAPDMATVTLGVVAENAEAAIAVREMSARMADVLAQLAAAGLAERDVQTSGLSLQPRWEDRSSSTGDAPRIATFEASSLVTVRVRELDRLGAMLDAVAQDGANRFHGLTFGLQEPQPVQDDARRDAVADAKRKAELYAEAAGVSLGPILSIEEHGGGVEPRMMRAAMEDMAANSVPVAAGEVGLSASVSITWSLLQPE